MGKRICILRKLPLHKPPHLRIIYPHKINARPKVGYTDLYIFRIWGFLIYRLAQHIGDCNVGNDLR